MTWNPRYLVRKAPGVDGPPIPPDEPCLVIRAQDELAPAILRHYFDLYANGNYNLPHPPVMVDLLAHLEALEAWQKANPSKVKRADR